MPHSVATLRTMEHATQAYILLIDGIPYGFTTDTSGELVGSGASSFIGRAESDLGETVGGRTLVAGLKVPDTLEFGSDTDTLGLGRTTARFSVLMEPETFRYLSSGGEEPEEMLGRLAPTDDPAPATVVGVTVRSRYIGLEYIGSNGERRMFPSLIGETLQGLDHYGDTDGATVPAAVSEYPLVHEGRACALYRVYRDPSSTSVSNSDAWPSLSNYRPIWVGKLRDAGSISAGGRITLECTGPESLLERNMATTSSEVFGVRPEFTAESGVDDQVAIYFGSGPQLEADGTLSANNTYEGRNWTTLSGSTRVDIRSALETLIQDTQIGASTDYETGEVAAATVGNFYATLTQDCDFVVRRDEYSGTPFFYMEMRIAMHRRRWLALGYDPIQQDAGNDPYALEDQKEIHFEKLTAGDPFEPRENAVQMGTVPGPGYWMGVFTTVPIGASNSLYTQGNWDNGGAWRYHSPLFRGGEIVRIIKRDGGQILRMDTEAALLSQSHLAFSGSVGGTDCDAAGWFLIKGKIRNADPDEQTVGSPLIVEDETEQAVIARCSWVVRDDFFADGVDEPSGGLYVEELEDPRKFGYPYPPLDRDWATLELQCVQLHSWATGAVNPEPMPQTLSAMLRSTGTSTGPNGSGVIQQGDNSGTSSGWYGDIFSQEMGLGVPDYLLPSGDEIADALSFLPNGPAGQLARCRPVYEGSFSSMEALRALMEPRLLRFGFDGQRFGLYRLRDESPQAASVAILESDVYAQMGDATSAYPQQRNRALAPVDAWSIEYQADDPREIRARDPSASVRRGDNIVQINGRGLVITGLYGDDPAAAPAGIAWPDEARILLGQDDARFRARRHRMVTLPISRPKGQDIYNGTIVTLSNPWVYNDDGTQGISGVVGRVVRATHHTRSGHCVADILVFEGQWQSPPHYSPTLWIQEVVSSTQLTIATSSDFTMGGGSIVGWTQPEWSAGAGGNLVASLWRQLPDGTWTEVDTAEVSSVNSTTVTLATALSAMPPDNARTMILTLAPMADQPAWAQEIYSAVGIQGDNTRCRRFL
jgi:hypothetical protein